MRGDTRCEVWLMLQGLVLEHLTRLPGIAADLRLSTAQCQLLRLVEPGRPSPMGRLAGHLACDASNVTGIVDRLEARGLVRRSADLNDRRVRVICLTRRGAVVRRQLLSRLAQAPPGWGRLTPDERGLLAALLRKALEDSGRAAYP